MPLTKKEAQQRCEEMAINAIEAAERLLRGEEGVLAASAMEFAQRCLSVRAMLNLKTEET